METQHFGKWRRTLWPIHNYEIKKLLPMLLMFFFISFNYSVLRNIKDSLIITAPGSSAETIPYLKFGNSALIAFTLNKLLTGLAQFAVSLQYL